MEHGELAKVLELEQLHLLVLGLAAARVAASNVLILHTAWILRELWLDVRNILYVLWLVLILLGSRCPAAYLAHADLFVALQGEVHAVFPEGDLQVIREVSQLVPSGHLLLGEGPSDQPLQVLVVPHVVLVGVRQ